MDNHIVKRNKQRSRRLLRVRKPLRGTFDRPRLSVLKTNRHLSVQLIDDEKGITVASTGTFSKENRATQFTKKSKEAAKHVGTKIAELAKSKQIQKVIFDRGRLRYHGIIAELANAAREAGLQF
jgi:large subunit ribosomal protein L18